MSSVQKASSGFLLSFVLGCLLPCSSAAGQADCEPSWVPTFGEGPGVSGNVLAMTVFDDGGGPALYAGGQFTLAGGVVANRIAKWDGLTWSALGSGMNGAVNALAVFDDGGGPALYAGGAFVSAGGVAANRVAKWDGTSWSALGSGVNHIVASLGVFDDGGGAALYVSGQFTSAGGVPADRIAKWDGTTWSALGSGLFGQAFALTTFDDGGGPALYAGGNFTSAGGVAASFVAKWDGASWSALGSGITGPGIFATVRALAAFDDGSGPALYAGGDFATAGGAPARKIARWDGASWSTLGTGLSGGSGGLAFAVFDDGGGPALYVGGHFTSAGGVAANHIAKWDGTSWSSLGAGLSGNASASALAVLPGPGGPTLFAGGSFQTAGEVLAGQVAAWDGATWSALGDGLNGPVRALTVFDDGSGAALYAGGTFTAIGGAQVNHAAKWDGTGWSALGSGLNGDVHALAVFDDGGGPALYAGGAFTSAGGVAAPYVAKWDGAGWAAVGGGLSICCGIEVRALAVYDDGGGPALYAGGFFISLGGVAANYIAKWDGTSWSALGTGLSDGIGTAVNGLAVFDDGGGSELYVGGNFDDAGGAAFNVNNVAKWDGTTWSAVGSGMNGTLYALTVYDDGSGPAPFAGGGFDSSSGSGAVPLDRIAKWNGTSWSALGDGLAADDSIYPAVPSALTLTVFDDGGGQALYVGGHFTAAGGVAAGSIAKWDGTSWSALGNGLSDVRALAVFDDGTGSALYAGGDFFVSPAGDRHLAKWGCAITAVTGCAGNPATLAAEAPSAPLGATLSLLITGSGAVSGLGLVAFGAAGFDASGCGLFVPGLGELLLAPSPPPKLLASAALSGGSCQLSIAVPPSPSLALLTVHLQGAAVDALAPQPIELSNALAVKLGP